MNLDEAIKHAEEVAEENEEIYEAHCRIYSKEVVEKYPSPPCKKCAEEHRQLAEWLRELKDYRKAWDEVQKEIYRQIDALDEMHEFRDRKAYFKALDIVNKYLKEVQG